MPLKTYVTAVFIATVAGLGVPAQAQKAAALLNAPDDQTRALSARTGTWEVVMTFQPTPDAKPQMVRDIVADRKLVGRFLQETMHPSATATAEPFERDAYLTYSRIEGRWQYVSLDTRTPVGIMPAYSFDRGNEKQILLQFEPLAFVGMNDVVDGKMLRSNMVITFDGPNHDLFQQYWISSDGTERKWLAVQYEYRRRK